MKRLVLRARRWLTRRRDARASPCEEVREELANLRGRSLGRRGLRRHLRACPRCREFRERVREQRAMLAAALPVTPSAGLKASVLSSLGLGQGPGGGALGGGAAGGSASFLTFAGALARIAAVSVLLGGVAVVAKVALDAGEGEDGAEGPSHARARAGQHVADSPRGGVVASVLAGRGRGVASLWLDEGAQPEPSSGGADRDAELAGTEGELAASDTNPGRGASADGGLESAASEDVFEGPAAAPGAGGAERAEPERTNAKGPKVEGPGVKGPKVGVPGPTGPKGRAPKAKRQAPKAKRPKAPRAKPPKRPYVAALGPAAATPAEPKPPQAAPPERRTLRLNPPRPRSAKSRPSRPGPTSPRPPTLQPPGATSPRVRPGSPKPSPSEAGRPSVLPPSFRPELRPPSPRPASLELHGHGRQKQAGSTGAR